MIESKSARSIALLIDGDNAQPSMIGKIIKEISQYGIVTIRRIYGDWTEPNMASWKNVLQLHAIQPMQQFRIVTAKNSTDNAMIIDAMDILHGKNVSGFCIVSSDSDFTRLATRIRENKLFVIGIGREETPPAFKKACSLFITTKALDTPPATITPPDPVKKLPVPVEELPVPVEKLPTPVEKLPTKIPIQVPHGQEKQTSSNDTKTLSIAKRKNLLRFIRQAFAECPQEGGWVSLSNFGSKLSKTDFNINDYGQTRLSSLILAYPSWFEARTKNSHMEIRLKISAT
jgi:uncharacterized LabA/DUF88 family protein